MNMDILSIVLPALLVLLTAYLLLDRMLKNDEKYRAFELHKQNVAVLTPARLRAYERLTLFLERTMPHALMVEVVKPDMNCMQLHARLLEVIRQEYAHNVSQQVYVSDTLWESVVGAKESLLRLVNTCAASCRADEPAAVLAEKVIQVYASTADTPSEIALAQLKEEIRKVF